MKMIRIREDKLSDLTGISKEKIRIRFEGCGCLCNELKALIKGQVELITLSASHAEAIEMAKQLDIEARPKEDKGVCGCLDSGFSTNDIGKECFTCGLKVQKERYE